jgi:ABC-2 type transport system ATP-binding protein
MLDLIDRVRKEHGIHLIFASHLLPDVERLCDQVWVMDKGHMKMADTVENLTAAARGAKRVRINGGDHARFAEVARGSGLDVEPGRIGGEYVLVDPDGIVEPEQVFALAGQAGVPVTGVKPAARSLEDAFLEALEAE